MNNSLNIKSSKKSPFNKSILLGLICTFNLIGIVFTDVQVRAENASNYYEVGIEKLNQEDFSGATIAFEKTIEIDPNYPGAYFSLGLARESNNDKAGAIFAYTKALKNDPTNGLIYNNRARSKYLSGDVRGSCIDLKRAVSVGNKESKVILNGPIGSYVCSKAKEL